MTAVSWLSESQRRAVFEKVLQVLDRKFMGPEPDTAKLRQEHEEPILRSGTGEEFEAAMNRMLRSLGASHVGFALGPRPHHGHVAMLVNEHSASAAEMVAAFASEYKLATLVGVKTAGRLVATGAFKVGFGYRVMVPVATYFTWHGTNLEGRGVVPDIEEPLSPEALWNGDDNQLQRARDLLGDIETTARQRYQVSPS